MDVEGPSLLIVWSDEATPLLTVAHRFYPKPKCSLVEAEGIVLEWYRKRKCVIRRMEWAWGVWPRLMPKGRFVPAPVRPRWEGR